VSGHNKCATVDRKQLFTYYYGGSVAADSVLITSLKGMDLP